MFLDRDGTLVEEVAYLHDPDRVVLLPGVGSGLRRLAAAGVRLDAVLHCPHHPEGTVPGYARVCRCRKPGPCSKPPRRGRRHGRRPDPPRP